jgi:hypothetical protein
MSLRPGNWSHPECVLTAISVTLPPQPGQLRAAASSGDPHQEQRAARDAGAAGGGAADTGGAA